MTMEKGLAGQLRSFDTDLFAGDERQALSRMLREAARARVRTVNRRDAKAWARVGSRADWEAFCGPRVEALRRSLGVFPPVPKALRAEVTGAVDGDGYRIENVVYESRPGVFVPANLYLPAPPREGMPAILIVHSHHNPKTQDELQDMGMTWARQGCAALVMDQLGYGERRWHAPGPRQDYRFRYVTGVQLHVIGDSLMGWMVWDVMRGVDLLLGREGVDREKVVLIGAVAGGGDPAAVAASLDPRVACAIPFNFGGPQPETVYPLPDDAEETFNYMGGGGWESTRGLRLSGRDGFLHWAIVASVAPRRLVYAHEFSWDRERDPVWRRLQRVFGFYGAVDRLAFAHGAGLLSGRPPEATHCNNVGAVHRGMIYPALRRWFGMEPPGQEVQERRPAEGLACLTPEWVERHRPRPLNELFGEIGASRAGAMRASLTGLTPEVQRGRLRQAWGALLGEVEPKSDSVVKSHDVQEIGRFRVEQVVLEVEPGIVVPVLLMLPGGETGSPVVVGVSQDGKGRFRDERAGEVAALLTSGIAVCLPDVRGTGETRPDGSRARQSEATSLSATELMLGGTLLGARLRDLRSVLRYLRTRREVTARVALWGESFAPTNPAGFADPLMDGDGQPAQSEPLGGLLALFGALYEEGVCAVVARGALAGYQSLLRDRYCYIPHDAVVPGALTAGDLCDVAAALAPRPLRLEGLVDGRNCLTPEAELERLFEPTRQAYREAAERLLLAPAAAGEVAGWLAGALKDGQSV
jgi:cephalosporin-C deacetylase-like acetyl esterase